VGGVAPLPASAAPLPERRLQPCPCRLALLAASPVSEAFTVKYPTNPLKSNNAMKMRLTALSWVPELSVSWSGAEVSSSSVVSLSFV
jgi:hypothetical protein